MRSSYAENNYAAIFYDLVSGFRPVFAVELGVLDGYSAIATGFRPVFAVELGVLDGYSAIAIGKALRDNHSRGLPAGYLEAYDLFENYPYNHGILAEVQKEIEKAGLAGYIALKQEDAFIAAAHYKAGEVDFLHVDLSNTGEIVRRIMELWDIKLKVGALLLFEGGTEERDQAEWMIKYKKEPIRPEIEANAVIKRKYSRPTIYGAYPGLTLMVKIYE